MADTVILMNNGLIQQIASPEEIYSNPANLFTARFIGSPAMNIVALQGGNRLGFGRNGEFSQEKNGTPASSIRRGLSLQERCWGVRRPIPCGIRWGEPIW